MRHLNTLFLFFFVVGNNMNIIADAQQFINDAVLIEIAKVGDSLAETGSSKVLFGYTFTDSTVKDTEENEKEFQKLINKGLIKKAPIDRYKKYEIEIIFKNTKRRVIEKMLATSIKGEQLSVKNITAYNNEKTDVYKSSFNDITNKLQHIAAVSSKYSISDPHVDPRFCGYYIWGTPVHKFLTGEFYSSSLAYTKQLPDEVIDGIQCSVIRAETVNGDSTITAYLAPEYLYRPVKIEVEGYGFVITSKAKYRLLNNGVWYPEKVHYSRSVNGLNKHIGANEAIMKVLDTELCDDIDNEMFEIRFPRGMRVYDARIDEAYLAEYDLDEQ